MFSHLKAWPNTFYAQELAYLELSNMRRKNLEERGHYKNEAGNN